MDPLNNDWKLKGEWAFKTEEIPLLQVDALVRIEALNKAIVRVMIQMSCDGDDEKIRKYSSLFNQLQIQEAAEILDYYYSKYGYINLNDVLPDNNKTE